ncbi:MAG: OmpL47-type beta-barrel domain-containing protein, partial [Anaerolineae bacterium]
MARRLSLFTLITLLVLLMSLGGPAGAQVLQQTGLGGVAYAQGPQQAGFGTVRFLVTADTHYGGNNDVSNDLLRHLFQIREENSGYRGILIAGDLTWGHFSPQRNWNQYKNAIESDAYLVYDGWGNHDQDGDAWPDIFQEIGGRNRSGLVSQRDGHYSWDWGGVHFVQLNLFPSNSACNGLDPKNSLAFLQTDLATNVGNTNKPVVLIHHGHLRSGDLCVVTDANRVSYWNAIANYNVIAIFDGHIHSGDGTSSGKPWFEEWRRPSGGVGGPISIPTFEAGPSKPIGGWLGGYFLKVEIGEDNCPGPCPCVRVGKYQFLEDSEQLIAEQVDAFPDRIAPITTAELFSTGQNGWYTSTVSVELTADDGGCGSGIASTWYNIDTTGPSWIFYASPFNVPGEGIHTVRFYSRDNAGNQESEKEISFRIDQTAPAGSLLLNGGSVTTTSALVWVGASASDATSGMYQMRFRDAGGSWTAWRSYTDRPLLWQLPPPLVTGQTYTVEAQFKDRAGNLSAVVDDSILLDLYPPRPSSADYRLVKSTWGASGTGGSSSGSSSNYIRYDTLGQPSLIGTLTSANYALASGYWAGYKCNTAPALDASGSPALDAINEDEVNNNGTLVSAIISSVLPVDMITDPDPGAVEGIAVTAVDNTNGTWQYSTNGGATWSGFGTPSASAARLLASDADTRIRFVPNADWSGTVDPGLTFRAWDQFSGTNGDTADTTTNGGVTAFSSATETASITVNPVNDAPSFTKGGDQTVNEDAGLQTVSGWATNISPGPANESSQILTFTVTNNNSGLFASQPAIAANGTLTYEPAANANGSAVVTVTLQDDGGTANGGVDTSPPQTFIITVRTAADLVVTKQAKPEPAVPGQDTITYTVVVSNPGPSSITGVTLTDDFPAEVDSPTWTCTGVACPSGSGSGHLNETLNLPENSVVTYTITGTVAPSATSLVNTASVNNPAYETNPGDNSATVTTTLTPETDLSISKSSERAGLAGTPITYTIVVRNAGPSDAYGATVSDSVPAGVSGFTWSCTASGGATCSGSGSGDINDTVNVSVGGVVTYTVNGTVTTDDPIINTASVTAPVGATDPVTDNNHAVDHSGSRILLPLTMKGFVSAPDLVVDDLIATSNAV